MLTDTFHDSAVDGEDAVGSFPDIRVVLGYNNRLRVVHESIIVMP